MIHRFSPHGSKTAVIHPTPSASLRASHGGLGHLDSPAFELGGDPVEGQVVQVLGKHDPGDQSDAWDAFVDDADHRFGLGHTALGAFAAGVLGTKVTALDELGRNDVQLLALVPEDVAPEQFELLAQIAVLLFQRGILD